MRTSTNNAKLDREIAAALAKKSPERSPYGHEIFKTGEKKRDEVIAQRKTFDDKTVALWSDGSITWGRMGTVIKGSPNARTDAQIEQALAAGWLALGEVELCDADEVPGLIGAARKVAAKGGTPGDVRREFAKDAPLRPIWEVLEADRNGRPTLRVWRLPRLTHPGMAVWDTARTAHLGRYEVMTEMRGAVLGRRSTGGTYAPTGVRFHDLTKLAKYLRDTSQFGR